LLRPGGLPRADIEAALGRKLADLPADQNNAQPLAPGLLTSHYAPRTSVRLNAERLEAREALLAFGRGAIPGQDKAAVVLNLSERGDLTEAAANLFGHLRALDAAAPACIAVMPIPETGLGEAINDRLRRAAG
jgi:L-threonylcarbamoyladenylate synthase